MASKIPDLWCRGCGRLIDPKSFWYNYNEFHKEFNYGRHFYCKNCCKKISRKIMNKYWKKSTNPSDGMAYELGFRSICCYFDMPFISDAVKIVREIEMSNTRIKEMDYVYQYNLALKDLDIAEEYWNDLSGNTFLACDLLSVAKPTSEGDADLLNYLREKWGIQESLEDYLALANRYSELTNGEDFNPFIDGVFKKLCLAELDYTKAREAKEDTSQITTQIIKYGKLLGVDKFVSNKSKSAVEKSIIGFIPIHEKIKPMEEFVKDFHSEDICGIHNDYDHIMRATKNSMTGSTDYPKLETR